MRYAVMATIFLLVVGGAWLVSGDNSQAARPPGNKLPEPGEAQRPIAFGQVWCPDARNSGKNFRKVDSYDTLPNDPIGDGRNNCYMEAFDTRVFSNDGNPLQNCANLDLKNFPGHTCREIRTQKEFKSLAFKKKLVAIIVNDLEVQQGFEPYLSSTQQSLVVIGVYDERTRRPVLITRGSPGPSTFFNWNVNSDRSRLMLINLRMHGVQCVIMGDRGKTKEFVGVSLTGKCSGRFMIASAEKDNKLSRPDNSVYLKNVMARAKNSHTIYLDRTWLNWIEDSIVMGPWIGGKHAAKYTGQNVVVKNSLHSNEGVHGSAIDDAAYFDPKKTWLGKGGLAPISMASCNRAVLDGVTVVNHVINGNSNPQPIQWQFRDALGAGCDMPRIYRSVKKGGPHMPYFGPTWYEGKLETPSSAWEASFWRAPRMLESFVVNTQVIQSYGEKNPGHGGYYALMSDGTYPSIRDSSSSSNRRAADKIPDGWIERQRVHVSGNCLDNGIRPGSLFSNHVLRGMGKGGRHNYDNTDRFVEYGSNQCAKNEAVANEVKASISAYLKRLPPPPWESW